MKNISYKTNEIKKYFSQERIIWEHFYYSERKIIELYFKSVKKKPDILDIGCGCGGLGLALKSKFNIKSYTGIEINKEAADHALNNNENQNIIHGDFLEIYKKKLLNTYDLVFSLSCFDWQLNFNSMLSKSWNLVNNGGSLIISLRLTEDQTLNNINKSYQYINYSGFNTGEVAPYVVLNAKEILSIFKEMGVKEIRGYGFYGYPSRTAITPYKTVCFTVFLLTKIKRNDYFIDIDMPIKF